MPRNPSNTPDDPSAAGAGGPSKPIRAGKAFLRMAERDPATREALRRFQAGMRAAAALFQSEEFRQELERDRHQQEEAIERLAEQIRQTMRATGDELAARGFKAPETLEEWEHLARIVEMPFETIRSGNYTFSDVYVTALAWIDRQQLKERFADQASRKLVEPRTAEASESAPARRTYTVAALREMTTLANTALNEYAKKAEVATPRRGQRSFRYSEADVRKILRVIIERTTDMRVATRCQTALSRLEITK